MFSQREDSKRESEKSLRRNYDKGYEMMKILEAQQEAYAAIPNTYDTTTNPQYGPAYLDYENIHDPRSLVNTSVLSYLKALNSDFTTFTQLDKKKKK